jgi:hypothetical protein
MWLQRLRRTIAGTLLASARIGTRHIAVVVRNAGPFGLDRSGRR